MKKKQTDWNKIFIYLPLILVIFSLYFLGYGMYYFFVGFANQDLGHNMGQWELIYGNEITDKGTDGLIRNPKEVYLLGYSQVKYGIERIAIGYFLILISWLIKYKLKEE